MPVGYLSSAFKVDITVPAWLSFRSQAHYGSMKHFIKWLVPISVGAVLLSVIWGGKQLRSKNMEWMN